MTEIEGVIKFILHHDNKPLNDPDVSALIRWRKQLSSLGLVGHDPHRYGGYGFGNLSCRTKHGFLITGSQTGHKATLQAVDFAEVTSVELSQNEVFSRGVVPPSSESLTHAAVYQADTRIQCVLHAHSPDIWQQLNLPATLQSINYGTPQMADAVFKLVRQLTVHSAQGLFRMAGHEDGVVSFAADLDTAGNLMLDAL